MFKVRDTERIGGGRGGNGKSGVKKLRDLVFGTNKVKMKEEGGVYGGW